MKKGRQTRLVVIKERTRRATHKTDKNAISAKENFKNDFLKTLTIENSDEEEEEKEEENVKLIKSLQEKLLNKGDLKKECNELVESKEFASQTEKLDEIFDGIKSKILYEKDLEKEAIKIVNESCYGYEGTLVHKFNNAIIGPRKSGKSIFMKYLCKEIILNLANNNELEKKLIINLDFDERKHFKGTLGLYKTLINVVFDEIGKRIPFIDQNKQKIINHFLSLPGKDKTPMLPKTIRENSSFLRYASPINELTHEIIKVLHDPSALEKWFEIVSKVPYRIAKIFGFDIIWIIDHFDAIDFSVVPQVPFNEAPYSLFLIEFVKKMITLSEFVIASQDDDRFFSSMQQNESYGMNIVTLCKYQNIADLNIEEPILNTDIQGFVVEFKGDFKPIKVTSECVGSCPGYLAIWNYLMMLFEERKETEISKAIKIDIVSGFLSLIFDEKSIPLAYIKNVKKII